MVKEEKRLLLGAGILFEYQISSCQRILNWAKVDSINILEDPWVPNNPGFTLLPNPNSESLYLA